MSSTQDCVFNALGGGGHINDLLLSYYQANGATSSDINDAEKEFLLAKGANDAHVNDMWWEVLSGNGYTGSLQDMKNELWCVGGGVLPPLDYVPSLDFSDGRNSMYLNTVF